MSGVWREWAGQLSWLTCSDLLAAPARHTQLLLRPGVGSLERLRRCLTVFFFFVRYLSAQETGFVELYISIICSYSLLHSMVIVDMRRGLSPARPSTYVLSSGWFPRPSWHCLITTSLHSVVIYLTTSNNNSSCRFSFLLCFPNECRPPCL